MKGKFNELRKKKREKSNAKGKLDRRMKNKN